MCVTLARAGEAEPAETTQGLLRTDYQSIALPGRRQIDLASLQLLSRIGEGVYAGVGGYAPLFRGNFGGFTAFDLVLHGERQLAGPLFLDAGLGLGAGAGGNTNEQSKELTGKGRFARAYAGLGWRFDGFSAGFDYSRIGFQHGVLDHGQLDAFVSLPFRYFSLPIERAGQQVTRGAEDLQAGENILAQDFDRLHQIDPEGTNKSDIQLAGFQFSHFVASDQYLFMKFDIGVSGLPLYNELLVGAGLRLAPTARTRLYAQLGLGSGGYAADQINTGSGLLVYPKLSVEYLFTDRFGLALSGGVLMAPRGSSKNTLLGLSLNYHIRPDSKPESEREPQAQGVRLTVFGDTQFGLRVGDSHRQDHLVLLTTELDTLLDGRFYIPLQGGIATNTFFSYPGYGALLSGLGVQTRATDAQPWQAFAQMLVGANVVGKVAKPELGLSYQMSAHLALNARVGRTFSLDGGRRRFSSGSLGLGLSYGFAQPSW
jgi:hypothetical protein